MNQSAWVEQGRQLYCTHQNSQFQIGDWVNVGIQAFGRTRRVRCCAADYWHEKHEEFLYPLRVQLRATLQSIAEISKAELSHVRSPEEISIFVSRTVHSQDRRERSMLRTDSCYGSGAIRFRPHAEAQKRKVSRRATASKALSLARISRVQPRQDTPAHRADTLRVGAAAKCREKCAS